MHSSSSFVGFLSEAVVFLFLLESTSNADYLKMAFNRAYFTRIYVWFWLSLACSTVRLLVSFWRCRMISTRISPCFSILISLILLIFIHHSSRRRRYLRFIGHKADICFTCEKFDSFDRLTDLLWQRRKRTFNAVYDNFFVLVASLIVKYLWATYPFWKHWLQGCPLSRHEKVILTKTVLGKCIRTEKSGALNILQLSSCWNLTLLKR